MAATVQQEQQDMFSRFYDLAPHKPYCTDDKGAGLRISYKEKAFKKKYVQHNPPAMCHWLTFDQDHEDILRWEKAGVAEPNLIVRNQDNRRCHVSYAIESVCTSPQAKPKPLAYAAAIQNAYCTKLAADRAYSGLITKNPMSAEWHTWELHPKIYTLNELADYVELEKRYWTRQRAANLDHYGLGRNCALFHRLRFWAYDRINLYRENGSTYENWMRAVLEQCESYNDFTEALPYSEVKSTARSVGKWVWTRYWPQGKRIIRGAMGKDFASSQIALSLQTRQRLSARRTNEIQCKQSEEKIINAIGLLTGQGKQVTKAAVGRLVGLSRTQVSVKYSHLFIN